MSEIKQTYQQLEQELEVWRHGPSCWSCGDSGDVHQLDGEWLGKCNCLAAQLIDVTAERDRMKAENERLKHDLGVIDKALRGKVNDPDPLPPILPGAFSVETTYGLVAGILRERDQLRIEKDKSTGRKVLHHQVDTLAEWYANALNEIEQLKAMLIYTYNRGYMTGHHDTVEGRFTDIHQSDMRTYHHDVVAEIVVENEPVSTIKKTGD